MVVGFVSRGSEALASRVWPSALRAFHPHDDPVGGPREGQVHVAQEQHGPGLDLPIGRDLRVQGRQQPIGPELEGVGLDQTGLGQAFPSLARPVEVGAGQIPRGHGLLGGLHHYLGALEGHRSRRGVHHRHVLQQHAQKPALPGELVGMHGAFGIEADLQTLGHDQSRNRDQRQAGDRAGPDSSPHLQPPLHENERRNRGQSSAFVAGTAGGRASGASEG